MNETPGTEARLSALEGRVSGLRADICTVASEAAVVRMNALSAEHDLARTRREIENCRSLLVSIGADLPPTQQSARNRIAFVLERFDRALERQ